MDNLKNLQAWKDRVREKLEHLDSCTTYTDFWRDADGKSIHGDDVIYKQLPVHIKASAKQSDGRMWFEGYANTKAIDLENDIIEPTAFTDVLEDYMQRGLLHFMHDMWAVPIGKITEAKVDDNGLWVKGFINTTRAGLDVQISIEDGTVFAMSIGFTIRKATYDEETRIRTIHLLKKLWEISIVTIGANPFALFTQTEPSKSAFKYLSITDPGGSKEEKKNMSGTNTGVTLTPEQSKTLALVEKHLGKWDDSLGPIASVVADLQKNIMDRAAIITLMQEKATDLQKGLITQAEFDAYCKSVEGDFAKVNKDISTAVQGKKAQKIRYNFKDWRGHVDDPIYLKDENGRALPKIHQIGWKLFQAPVDYKTSPDGEFLKTVRDLYDQTLVTIAYFKGQNASFDITSLNCWKNLMQLLPALGDEGEELAKAMHTGTTAQGGAWVPQFMSAQMIELYRLDSGLENMFPHYEMPTNPYDWPILNGGATVYLKAEAATANPDEGKKTDLSTGVITFRTSKFTGILAVSSEQIEDSIVAMVPEIRSELAIASAEGFESAMINGDATSPHQDTGRSYTYGEDVETAFDGMRFDAAAASNMWDSQSTTLGGATAAFTAGDVRYNRVLMGIMGMNPRDLVHVCSITGYFKMMSFDEAKKPGDYNAGATWLTGELSSIDGVEIYVSHAMADDLDATGYYTGSNTEHTGVVTVNKRRGYRVGEKAGFTVEFEKNIRTDQWTFVSRRRATFKKVTQSTRKPVAYARNIETAGAY